MIFTVEQKNEIREFLNKYTLDEKYNDKGTEVKINIQTERKKRITHTSFSEIEEFRKKLDIFQDIRDDNGSVNNFNDQLPEDAKEQQLIEFYDSYTDLVNKEIKMSLIEMPEEVQPLKIDLDFRYCGNIAKNKKHLYDMNFIQQFIYDYMFVIQSVIDIPYETIEIFIMQKTHYQTEYEKDNITIKQKNGQNCYKDGVHIQMPQIVIPNEIALYIRHCYLNKEQTESMKMFNEYGYSNDFHTCLDQLIYTRSGWFMYGSGKPRAEIYQCTQIIECSTTYNDTEFQDERGEETQIGFETFNTFCKTNASVMKRYDMRELIEILAVKFKSGQQRSTLKKGINIQNAISALQSASHIIRQNEQDNIYYNRESWLSPDGDKPQRCYEGVKYIEKMVMNVLSDHRADQHSEWIELGWCLFNIAQTMDKEADRKKLLSIWDEFSKRCPSKYRVGSCQREWGKFKTRRLGIPTLKTWGRQDNFEKFQELNKQSIYLKIEEVLTNYSDYSVATALHVCYGDIIVCSNQVKKEFYHFKGHKWNFCDGGFYLKQFMSTDFRSIFCDYEIKLTIQEKEISEKLRVQQQKKLSKQYNLTLTSLDDDSHGGAIGGNIDNDDNASDTEEDSIYKISFEDRLKQLQDKKETISKIKGYLQDNGKKAKIFNECLLVFYNEDFKTKLDQNKELMGFKNGVYDFQNHVFRNGAPDDYISSSTNINYVKFNPESIEYQQINDYLQKVFVNKDVRKYMVDVLSSCLCNVNQEDAVFFLYGVGSNSKSILMDLVKKCFGDYYTSMKPQLLTDNDQKSNGPSPDLLVLKGVRIAVANEMDDKAVINASNFKRYSGRDEITARDLQKSNEKFEPICRIFCTTNNYITFSENTPAVYRRLKLIPFESRFVKKEQYKPQDPKCHLMDTSLNDKIKQWPEQFMSYLISNFKTLKRETVYQPEVITNEVEKYRQSQDLIYEFYSERIEKLSGDELDNDEGVSKTELWTHFKTWLQNNHSNAVNLYKLSHLHQFMKQELEINDDKIKTYFGIKHINDVEVKLKDKQLQQEKKKKQTRTKIIKE